MSTAIDRRTVVKTLAVRSSGHDALTDRARAEQLLGALDLHPPSLPPAAILCVRRLRDPRPGAVTLDGRSVRPPRGWEEAVNAALDALVRRAARPWQGSVGAGAEAVLFADRSELLACLAVDLARGDVGARWWWTSLLPDPRASRAAVAAWIDAPEHVPGALHLLAERREIQAFARALTMVEVRAIARVVLDRGGVPGLAAVIARAAGRLDLDLDLDLDPARPRTSTGAPSPREEPPWTRWSLELRGAAIDPEASALLGVALALHRAPEIARSTAFAGSVGRWADAERSAHAPDAPPRDDAEAPPRSPSAPPRPLAVAITDTAPRPSEASSSHPAPRDDAPRAPRASQEAPSSRETMETTPTLATTSPLDALLATPTLREQPTSPTADRDTQPGQSATVANAPSNDAPAIAPASPAADSPSPLPAPEPAPALDEPAQRRYFAPIATDLGGVFFLVNLALYLDLYGDFSAPLQPGLDLPLWDFVALVARDLLGDALLEDPVWPLLARLAGRDVDTAPGADFAPPDAWRMPLSWLRAFPEPLAWAWSTSGDLLTIRHPAGFDVVAVATEGDPAEQALREVKAYGAIDLVDALAQITTEPTAAVDRYFGRVIPYLRARLARAFGAANSAEDLGRRLCALPAQVHVTATHLDVMMSLADLPIDVRFAGLDRDPGWVPAAGRYIAFHFG